MTASLETLPTLENVSNPAEVSDNVSPSLSSEGVSQKQPAEHGPSCIDCRDIVQRIQRGEESGLVELYQVFARGIRYYFCRQLGMEEIEDKVHDSFLIIMQAIRSGRVREPERLMGFVRTVIRRQVAAHINNRAHRRHVEVGDEEYRFVAAGGSNPEASLCSEQKTQLMLRVLKKLSNRDREILTRFYLREETSAEICTAMNLTDTQFRLLKSRAKTRFVELAKRRLRPKLRTPFLERTSLSESH